jgi:hypothetical protein
LIPQPELPSPTGRVPTRDEILGNARVGGNFTVIIATTSRWDDALWAFRRRGRLSDGAAYPGGGQITAHMARYLPAPGKVIVA